VLSAINGLGLDLGIMVLVSGRIVFGMGIGFAMHAAPIYISEMGPSEVSKEQEDGAFYLGRKEERVGLSGEGGGGGGSKKRSG